MASGIVEPSSRDSEEEQQGQAPRSGERSKLVQRLLDAGPNLPAFLTDLLTAQAVTVAGTEAAGFLIERGDQQFGLRPLRTFVPTNPTPRPAPPPSRPSRISSVPASPRGKTALWKSARPTWRTMHSIA